VSPTAGADAIELSSQRNDFLIRRVDPYAAAKYEILLRWLGDQRGRTALVMGCGSGEFAALLARAGMSVKAVDVDPLAVQLTAATALRLGVTLATEVASLEDFQDESTYDVVAATDVIEHIADDGGAVERLIHLLSPEGRLVITVPALPALFGYHDRALGHYRRYTLSSLRTLLRGRAAIERVRYYGFFLIPVAFLVSRLFAMPYPVQAVGNAERGRGILGSIVRSVFRWERSSSPPLGTSLLLLGRTQDPSGERR
jgi:SAM-dependent methyltransferase